MPVIASPTVRRRSTSVPAVGVLGETGTLHPYDAKALTGRRLHHDPAFQAVHHLGAELLQARHFCRNVVSLDVDVDAAFVTHALDLHDGLARWGLKHAVVAAAARMLEIHRTAQRLTPEACRRVDIGRPAIDQHGA